eukprot:TRINITY_DN11685_c0_g1_i20.p1 TRINITY_DN11685_c0_g1~~TRINITY_DN11685_c0_g1_i20.p1  ORF type:complete len:104 (-),score=3.95 TRINITY_DN11685_c0_g1_i20:32-343(-)
MRDRVPGTTMSSRMEHRRCFREELRAAQAQPRPVPGWLIEHTPSLTIAEQSSMCGHVEAPASSPTASLRPASQLYPTCTSILVLITRSSIDSSSKFSRSSSSS